MQTRLESKAIERRHELFVKNDYDKNDAYSATHEDAKSHPESEDKPLGKGTGHGGHTHSVPNPLRSSTSYNYDSIDTNGGGGSYPFPVHMLLLTPRGLGQLTLSEAVCSGV